MLATASNIPTKLLIAIHHVLTDESLSSEQMCQHHESLCASSKTHDWLMFATTQICGVHSVNWVEVPCLQVSMLKCGGEENLPLNISSVSDQPNPFLLLPMMFKIGLAFMKSAGMMYHAYTLGDKVYPHDYQSWEEPRMVLQPYDVREKC